MLRTCAAVLVVLCLRGPVLSQNASWPLYDAWNVDPVAFVPLETLETSSVNDIAYWHDEEEEQTYALVGCENGTAILRMLAGGQPLYMGKLPTQSLSSLWRDIKVVNDHAYIVSEAPVHGMQVLDLTLLRQWEPMQGPQTWLASGLVPSPGTAHNIVAFPEGDMVIQVGTSVLGGGAVMFDVSDPGNPALAGSFGEWGSLHDGHALTYNGPDSEHLGKDVLFACGSERLWILDISDPTDVMLIGSTSYAGSHFSHQVWVSDSHDHAFLGDEMDELSAGHNTKTMVVDVSDLDAPTVVDVHEATSAATDHNQYVFGEWLMQSNYRSGLRVLSDHWPSLPSLQERAYFDPLVESDDPGFEGAWSHVVCQELGVVVMTSIHQGVWVLRPELARVENVVAGGCNAFPMDSTWSLELIVDSGWTFPMTVTVDDVMLLDSLSSPWVLDGPGTHLLNFGAVVQDGAWPQLVLSSQKSSWKIDMLNGQGPLLYADADGDGFGDPWAPAWSCGDLEGYSPLPLDCQDWNANTYPNAPELCDGWDNDCDSWIDEDTELLFWYVDNDGDGFGNSEIAPIQSCTQPGSRVSLSGDCNDNQVTMFPGAPAMANGLDNDCSGWIEVDELSICPGDFDGDGSRDINDMLHLLSDYGCESGCVASLTQTDAVGTDDLLTWLSYFGIACD